MKDNVIFKNFSTRILFTILSLVIGFFSTPLLLKFLGHEDFSLYRLTYDWLASISFLEHVVSVSSISLLASLSDHNRDHYTHYTFKKLIRISLIFIFLSAIMIPFLPYLFSIPSNKVNDIRLGFFIGSIGFIFLPITILRTWIEFHEKSYLLNVVRSAQYVLQIIVALLLAYLSFGVAGQFSAFLFGQFLISAYIYIYFKKHHKRKDNLDFSDEIHKFEKDLKKNNVNSLILSLTYKLSFLSDTLILGFFFKPLEILPFTLTQKLTQMLQDNLQNLGNSSWASLASLQRAEKHKEFEDTLNTLTRITIFLSIVMTTPLLFLNHSFIKLWVGEQFYAGDLLTSVAVINAYLVTVFSLWIWCLSGSGKVKAQIPIYTINAIINFVSALIFIKLVGLTGPIIGTLVGFSTAYLYMIPRSLEKEFQLNAFKLRKSILVPIFYLLIPVVLNFYFKNFFIIENYFKLAAYYIIIFSITASIVSLTYLNSKERSYIFELILKKINLKISKR